MKWKKFLGLVKEHPFLVNHLGCGDEPKDRKLFVRTKVDFISFRPFDKLDLSSREALICRHVSVNVTGFNKVRYQLRYHFEGEDDNLHLRNVTTDVGDGHIRAHIDEISEWFAGKKVFNGRQIIWRFVVKVTENRDSQSDLIGMSLEVYKFPRLYGFRRVLNKLPLDNSAFSAYVRGEELPPIIPGMIVLGTS